MYFYLDMNRLLLSYKGNFGELKKGDTITVQAVAELLIV